VDAELANGEGLQGSGSHERESGGKRCARIADDLAGSPRARG